MSMIYAELGRVRVSCGRRRHDRSRTAVACGTWRWRERVGPRNPSPPVHVEGAVRLRPRTPRPTATRRPGRSLSINRILAIDRPAAEVTQARTTVVLSGTAEALPCRSGAGVAGLRALRTGVARPVLDGRRGTVGVVVDAEPGSTRRRNRQVWADRPDEPICVGNSVSTATRSSSSCQR